MDRRLRFVLSSFGLGLIAAASAASCSSTVVITDCEPEEELCDTQCTNLSSNPDHCGQCGNDCGEGTCTGGVCVGGECAPPTVLCNGSCVDTQSDPQNCGSCGVGCDFACSFGQCVSDCPPGTSNCFGACVDTASDPSNCGGCGVVCSFDQVCFQSQCQGGEVCTPPFSNCFGECVDTQFDQQNCGFCGNDCGPGSFCEFAQCSFPPCEDPVCGVCDVVSLPPQLEFSVTGSTVGGTHSHTPICVGTAQPEVLHVFTPPLTGLYTFDTVGSSYDTTLELMTSGCELLECSDDVIGFDARIQAFLGAGEPVFLIVDGFDQGQYSLNVHFGEDECPDGLTNCNGDCVDTLFDPNHCGGCFSPCDFDEFCDFGECFGECFGPCGSCNDPFFLPSNVPVTFQNDSSGAPNDLQPFCAPGVGGEVLHYFQAPSAGNYVFSTANSGFDTVLSLIDAESCGELACNDNFGMAQTSRASLAMFAGQEVYVSVDSNNGFGGFYNLTITGAAAPACPTLALPSMVPQTKSGNTNGAGNAYQPSCTQSNAPEHTFTFTAPTTATYTFDTIGSMYDTVLFVLNGACVGQQLACNDDTFNLDSQVILALTAGQTVTIVVDGYSGQAGSYVLHVQ